MYEKFYAKQFSGRKLTWLHHLSNGDIKLGFLPKTYIINMTTFQMSILLLFEKSDNLSYNELKATTKISDDQFPRHVQSLLEAKLLVCNTPVSNQSNTYRVSHKYLDDFWKVDVASKLVKSRLQNFLCFLSILIAKISENLVAIALIISLFMAFLCHMIKSIEGHK